MVSEYDKEYDVLLEFILPVKGTAYKTCLFVMSKNDVKLLTDVLL